jgi:hypothetical protein
MFCIFTRKDKILAIMSVSTFNSDVILYTINYQQQMFRMIFQTCQYIIYLFLPLNVIQCIIILYIWTPMFKTHMKTPTNISESDRTSSDTSDDIGRNLQN